MICRALVGVVLITLASCGDADHSDSNVELAMEAAEAMTYSSEYNRPYMIAKYITESDEVMLVFGFADNEAACDEFVELFSKTWPNEIYNCTRL